MHQDSVVFINLKLEQEKSHERDYTSFDYTGRCGPGQERDPGARGGLDRTLRADGP